MTAQAAIEDGSSLTVRIWVSATLVVLSITTKNMNNAIATSASRLNLAETGQVDVLHAKFKRDALVAIALFMFFVVIDRTTSVADTHILTVRLEPSSIAACAVMIGLLLMITERYAWSGLFVAVAGFVHTNYLLLDFVFFGLAHLALGRRGLVLRLILQFAPSLLPLFRELPMLYAMVGDPLAADARHIIAFIRAPHHELPLTSLQDFLPFVGWHLLAMSCIGMETANRGVSSRLVRVYLVWLGVVIVAALLTTVVVVPQISQLRFFRMAPVSIVLAQLIIVTSIGYLLGRGEEGRTAVPWRLAVAALGGAAILVHYVAQGRFLEVGLVVVGLVLVTIMVGGASGYLGQRLAGTPFQSAMMRSKWLPITVLIGGLVVSTAPPKYVAGLEPRSGRSVLQALQRRYRGSAACSGVVRLGEVHSP